MEEIIEVRGHRLFINGNMVPSVSIWEGDHVMLNHYDKQVLLVHEYESNGRKFKAFYGQGIENANAAYRNI